LSLLAQSSLLLGGAGVGLALLELAARWSLRRLGGYYTWWPGRRQRFELDLEALPTPVRWSVNRDGERGEAPPGPDESCYRVLLAGGSCFEGYYLDQAHTVASRVAAHLRQPRALGALGHDRVHVGSVARSRISCAQIRQMLERILPRPGRLDCVVLMVGASDLVRWFELGTPPAPWRDPVPLSHVFELHPEGPFGWSPLRLALRAVGARIHQRWLAREVVRERVGKLLIRQRERRRDARKLLDEVRDPSDLLEAFAAELGGLIELARTRAKTVVVVRQPWFDKVLTPEEERWMWNFARGEIYGTDIDVYYTHRLVRELLGKLATVCGETTRAHGAVDLDLTGRPEPGLENFYDFLHLTPRGADLVGRAVARAIVESFEREDREPGAERAAVPAAA